MQIGFDEDGSILAPIGISGNNSLADLVKFVLVCGRDFSLYDDSFFQCFLATFFVDQLKIYKKLEIRWNKQEARINVAVELIVAGWAQGDCI